MCLACGGWGKFLGQTCPSCKGKGGQLHKANLEIIDKISAIKNTLTEQEQNVFNLYKEGLTAKEIALASDISANRVMVILSRIDKAREKL